jgi:predicted acylesterase/phospholipase RssA
MYYNLVLSGGFLKATAILGAIKYLEEEKLLRTFKQFIGTSAGSIICFLIILGYSSTDIHDMITSEIHHLVDVHVSLDNILGLYYNLGMDDGMNLRLLLVNHLKIKQGNDLEGISFSDLVKRTGYNLIVTGTNINTYQTIYFNVDTHPDMNVIDALMISACIPPIYKPIRYNGDLYIDGGIYQNFPLEYFDKTKNDTLGIGLKYEINKSNSSTQNVNPTDPNFIEYITTIIFSLMEKINLKSISLDEYNICYIKFNTNISSDLIMCYDTLKLTINNENINEYFQQGYNQFSDFYKEHINDVRTRQRVPQTNDVRVIENI